MSRNQTVYVLEATKNGVTTWVCVCATREVAEAKKERFAKLGDLDIRETWLATERDV